MCWCGSVRVCRLGQRGPTPCHAAAVHIQHLVGDRSPGRACVACHVMPRPRSEGRALLQWAGVKTKCEAGRSGEWEERAAAGVADAGMHHRRWPFFLPTHACLPACLLAACPCHARREANLRDVFTLVVAVEPQHQGVAVLDLALQVLRQLLRLLLDLPSAAKDPGPDDRRQMQPPLAARSSCRCTTSSHSSSKKLCQRVWKARSLPLSPVVPCPISA